MRALAWLLVLSAPLCFARTRLAPPHLVKIGDQVYTVTVLQKFLDKSLVGVTDNRQHKIWILAGQALEDEQDAVLHELLHALLKDEHVDQIQTQHGFIYDSAGPEIKMLHDNPELVRYLTQ